VELTTIGYVRSTARSRQDVPPLGAPGAVELLPAFAPGLLHFEKHSHIWILAWLDQAARDTLQVIPRGVPDRSDASLHGVFAVRSPSRPNPIGLTLARVLSVDGNRIELDRIDFSDGTPVIDIKPYFVSRDMVFSARNQQVGRPADRSALRQALWMQAVNLHGGECGDLALGVRVMEHFRSEVLEMVEPAIWRVHVPRRRPAVIDAIMATTRETPGRGNLRFISRDVVRFEHDLCRFEYDLIATDDNSAKAVLDADDEDLFSFEVFG
jgi:tRNA (adenine37-N6)-methyltransferase